MPTQELLQRYGRPVPRYTSYPTAPHFDGKVDSETYSAWLCELPAGARLSLYLHMPFCDTLCWFCGCQTRQVRRYDPVAAYLPVLVSEMTAVAARVGPGRPVAHIHWGGGSPTILTPGDTVRLADAIRERFAVAEEAEFAVEIDPRGFGPDQARALARSGLTRASIGVQDFSERVQAAINRRQSFRETADAVAALRDLGVRSLNIDLVYGLPHQTADDLAHTLDLTIELRPDRIAVFGYAHVPWIKSHQRLIPDDSLPSPSDRFEQMDLTARRLVAAGYRRIGIDHFALPGDALARAGEAGGLRRNFQGYTTDAADALIGLGASAISRLPQGYAQNRKATGRYMAAVAADGLAVERGRALTPEDRMRGWFIERLLSDFRVSRRDLEARFAGAAAALADEARALAVREPRVFAADGRGFVITDAGRPFARAVAAHFDAYLRSASARHSPAV